MKAVVQTGIQRVVYLNELAGANWEESKEATMKLAELAAVEIRRFGERNEITDFLLSKIKCRKE
jgi:deoxycytidylate deaminase